jgi:hypothetical protein
MGIGRPFVTIKGKCFALVFVLLTVPASAQQSIVGGTRARITDRMVVGGSTFGEVMRIVGSPTVASGTGTQNPSVIDADGDVLEDSNTTVSTAGAWTWGAAGQFSSTLGVTGATTLSSTLGVSGLATLGAGLNLTGNLTPASGTLPVIGGLSTTGDIAINGNDLTSTGVLNVRPTGSLTLDPTGDIILDPDGNDVQPLTNYTINVGASNRKFLSFWAAEAWFDTIVAQDIMSTIGGRVQVGPTSSLLSDLAAAGTTLRVKHNSFRVNDLLRLEARWRVEFIKVTAGPTRVTSACGTNADGTTIAECWEYTITRNHDGTGANDWLKGDSVFGGCATVGDGCIDLTSIRGSMAIGYSDEVLADEPEVMARLNETSGTSVADATGHGLTGALGGTGTGWSASSPLADGGTAMFCGGTRHVIFPAAGNLTPLNGTATFEGWFNVSGSFGSGYWTLWSKGTSWSVDVNMSGALVAIHNGTETITLLSAGVLVDAGNWQHVAIVRDSATNQYKVYYNGTLTNTVSYTNTPTSNSTQLRACAESSGTQQFSGWIDDLSVFANRALMADDIAQHYAARNVVTRPVYRAGPTIDFLERTGTDFEDVTERATVGNLEGRYDYTSKTYGVAAGDATAAWFGFDETNGVRGMYGSTKKFGIDMAGVASFTEGAITINDDGISIFNSTNAWANVKSYGFTGNISYDDLQPGMFYLETGGNGNTVVTAGVRSTGTDTVAIVGDEVYLTAPAAGGPGSIFIGATTNLNLSAATITVDTFATATSNLSCSSGQAIKAIHVYKGIVRSVSCGAP